MMKLNTWILGFLFILFLFCMGFTKENQNLNEVQEKDKTMNNNVELIRDLIEEACITGIHTDQDEVKIRKGFHEDFIMYVRRGNSVLKVGIDDWLDRVEELKAEKPEIWTQETTYKSLDIDVSGYAAVAKLDVYKGETFFSTDFMLLYKFDDGWKIVSKVFAL